MTVDNAPIHPGRNFPRRILAVDDDPVVREFLRLYLTADGVDVDVVEDGSFAIPRLAEGYDVIVLDLEMPQVTGFEVLQALDSLRLPAPPAVVVLTSRTDAAAIGAAFELGAVAYLLKPVSKADLIAKVASAYVAATR